MPVPIPLVATVSTVALAVAALGVVRPDRQPTATVPAATVAVVRTSDAPLDSMNLARVWLSGTGVPVTEAPEGGAGRDESDVAAERAADNAESEALAAYLTAHRVAFTRTVDTEGWIEVAWNEDDEAANTAVDEFWWERDPYSPQEITEYNSETAEVSSLLSEAGIAHTIVTDPHGLQDVAYDENDDRANEIVDEYYYGGYCDGEDE